MNFQRPKKTGHPHLDRWDDLIYELSVVHQVDPAMAKAVMWKESSGNAGALRTEKSGAVSVGLFQLLDTDSPADAFERLRPGLTRSQLLDPRTNADVGIAYIAAQQKRYGNDPAKIYAAYNAGSALVFADDGADGNVVDAASGAIVYHHTYQGIPIKLHSRYAPGAFINQDEVHQFLGYYGIVKP